VDAAWDKHGIDEKVKGLKDKVDELITKIDQKIK